MPRPESPLDPDAGVVPRFAWELRRLREKAGSPTYRQLARRAHYSQATLAKAAGGRDLPSLAVTLAYVRACDGDEQEWEKQWREAAAETAPKALEVSTEFHETDAAVPYVGLAAFSPEDADRFFGREQLVAELVGTLERHRFLAVVGASGSGKSSLLRAGLLPTVREECSPVLVTPGTEPESRLRQALNARPSDTDVLLVVDQFEELFTLCPDLAIQERFITTLLEAVREPGSRTRVVLAVRADFYAHCAGHRELVAALREAQVLVGPMSTDELRTVITGPAVRFGYSVEGALVSRLIGDATGQPGVLPLLSHALLETWRRRRGNALTLIGYDAAGGIHRAIARTAEQAYASLDDQQRHLARQIFGRLVALSEGTEDTKRRVSRSELDHDDPTTAAVIDTLARARLVTVDIDSVEIAHEALIRAWPRLRDWLTEDREGLRIHRQLTETAQAWDSLDRDPGALYRGTRLGLARDWADTAHQRDPLNALERAFLDASDHAARRGIRRRRQLVSTLVVLLVLALAASGVAVYQRQTAVDRGRIVLVGKLIAQSTALAAGQPDASMLLAVEAFHQDPDLVEARSALLSSQSQYFAARLPAGAVDSVAFSPDGRILATASADTTTRLWDVANHSQIVTLTGHNGFVESVAFSPDGRILATAGDDKTVRLWDVASRSVIAILTGHTSPVTSVAFSPDGHTLATTSDDTTTRLWDVASRSVIAILTGHTSPVTSVAFSPDGRTLATAGDDKTVRLWDVASRSVIATLTGHTSPVTSVAFSPDGRTLATAGDDKTVRLWDVASRSVIATLTGHTYDVASVAFSPDGRTLATASYDKTVRLWDVASRSVIAILTGHTSPVYSVASSPDGHTLATTSADSVVLWKINDPVLTPYPATSIHCLAFSPDGRTMATASDDKTVRLWDVATHNQIATLTGHNGLVTSVAFSPDGRTLATTSADKTVRLWDVASRSVIATLTGHNGPVLSVAFSPDGHTLATTSADTTTRLWDVASHNQIAILTGHTYDVESVAFSPDGRTLATTSADKTVRLWDVASRSVIATLTGHTSPVTSVAFSPDGRTLATTSADKTVRLWDVASRSVIATLTGHNGPVLSVAFSPDGHTLATASDDTTVRLWDVASRSVIATLTGHTGPVGSVAFSSDGHTLATASDDTTVRLWDPDPARVIAHDCTLIGTITRARWEQLMPDLDYHPTCS
ncbi:nSTAND1 domain-containing NTPase [Kutzneria sp. CA-103260]|uniref:nSTAND1 domain-containing NTPase n=1 Tax=Kutzneria sp. CA-103260 TaxID=2802641 RepID=UPI001BADBE55|nr:helix-turn-helix domain-containing protein [Kutzneria sp. CA-103260]QUQ67135.1 WD-40 repeat-containing protein [Kutzneria sp. CA-103260]